MWFFVGMTLLFVHAYTVPLTLPALLIGSILSHLDFLDEQIEQLSDAIAEQIVPFAAARDLLMTTPGRRERDDLLCDRV